jgi:hypothetical protein
MKNLANARSFMVKALLAYVVCAERLTTTSSVISIGVT